MNQVYFNEPQLLTQWIAANTSVIVAGRRTGKTDSIAAPYILRCMQRMPGSTGGIVVPTYRHGLTNTIPGVFTAFRRWRYKEGIHYVIGKVPPDHFRRPLIKPFSYDRVISFCNGSVAILLSQDRTGTANSLTLSWLLVDEAKFIDYRKLKEETLPANGGSKSFFGRRSCNHALMILSDMPQTKRGSWFLNYEKKMDRELIEVIKGSLFEYWRLRERFKRILREGGVPPDHLLKQIRTLDRQINQMRSVATFYKEYSSIENLQLLGENYIRQMKRDLTPLTFQTSILCKRIGLTRDGFYSCMRESHLYDADDLDLLDSLGYDVAESDLSASADRDLRTDEPICIGMDYGANISWIVAGQPVYNRLNVLKSFYTKYERKLPELVADFCRYYADHRCKRVIYYYDATAIGHNAANPTTYYSVVRESFMRHGWEVTDKYIGQPKRHDMKYLMINQAFKGKQRLQPFLNRHNNEALITAMQAAGVERGRLGFRKDKSGEKLAETEEDLLEYRTDGTDAFDTLYIGCEEFPAENMIYFASGVC